ncbi:MAG: hypothetical protein AAGA58_17495 [Verrucomicrobiota bacterium]
MTLIRFPFRPEVNKDRVGGLIKQFDRNTEKRNKTMKPLKILTLFAFLISGDILRADVPDAMNYSGYLTDALGDPIAPTQPENKRIQFRIYNSATSSNVADLLWGEEQTVTVFKGNFSVVLGNGTGVPEKPASSGRTVLATVFSDGVASEYYLGITPEGGSELTPRQSIITSAFSFRAKVAETAETVESLPTGFIGSTEIADGAVTTEDISDGSLVIADLAPDLVEKTLPGNVQQSSSGDLEYVTPKMRRLVISNFSFETNSDKEHNKDITGLFSRDTSGSINFAAPVQLPQNAVIKKVTARFDDNSGGGAFNSLLLSLNKIEYNVDSASINTFQLVSDFRTSGPYGSTVISHNVNDQVDNFTYTYSVSVGFHPTTTFVFMQSVFIDYELTEID